MVCLSKITLKVKYPEIETKREELEDVPQGKMVMETTSVHWIVIREGGDLMNGFLDTEGKFHECEAYEHL